MPAATDLAPSRTMALRQHGGGGGAVAGGVIGLAGDFAHHLGAHIFELVGQFDFLGHRHAVLGGARSAEALVDHDVAALGAQRHLAPHRPGCRRRAASFSRASAPNFTSFAAMCIVLLNSLI